MPLSSTPIDRNQPNHLPEWHLEGLRFYPLSRFLRQKFGRRVWKISVDAGLNCPNVDGTLARGGCIFCNIRSFSPSRRFKGAGKSVAEQIAEGTSRLQRRYGAASADTFIAYFQPATNTHGSKEELLPLWQQALAQPGVVGLAIGTRPDCVGTVILDTLAELAEKAFVSLELGLQSVHQMSLDWLRRYHDFACFEDAVGRAHDRGLHVSAHLILGLPTETGEDSQKTAAEMARLEVDAVKLHNLYVVRNTPLAELWQRGEVQLPGQNEYVSLVVDFLERLPPDCVIERLAGDAPPQFLLAPDWCCNGAAVGQAVTEEFDRRGTRQASLWIPPSR